MRITDDPCHLTYCLNVHPGETWQDNLSAIRNNALQVRDAILPDDNFGLGLRLSARAAEELAAPGALNDFRSFMTKEHLYAFTINGFPYGTFHGTPVKRDVYKPDWRSRERKDYTMTLAGILDSLLPQNTYGSISTVPVSYRPWISTDEDLCQAVNNLCDTAADLAAMRSSGGCDIRLALEPEPDCFLETTDDCITFFKDSIFPKGARYLADTRGISREQARDQLQHHIGICLDTCHMALQFEDSTDSLQRLHAAGITIPKVQISSALSAQVKGPASTEQLRAFCDPVYLHQVSIRNRDGSTTRFPDLAPALAAEPDMPGEWRIHCHVPLDFTGSGDLSATARSLDDSFITAARNAGVQHFEIETYTFDVLPSELQRDGVTSSIIREYNWVITRMISDELG